MVDRPDPHSTVSEVEAHRLPPRLAAIADRYDAAVGVRDRFLWKWFHHLNPAFRLSSVAPAHERKVRTDKSLLTFYVTLLDDLVDERDDLATFQEAAKVPFDHCRAEADRRGVDRRVLSLAEEVWDAFERSARCAPRFGEFVDLLRYDLQQAVNAVRYGHITNRYPQGTTLRESYDYASHNMAMFSFADVDLMHSPSFERRELRGVRSCIWTAQRMARIGNWVSTWKRELASGDLTSGVLVCAAEQDIVSEGDLQRLREDPDEAFVATLRERIDREAVPALLLEQWRAYYEELAVAADLDSVDIDRFRRGMRRVMQYHVESEGRK
ncbi:terpene synthase family protein [Halomarina litorea]|uniref:terpene synthase family protein n=1 Tax=Halomarina litorea TaxID=2961595 RepID=UPI0020C3E89F|nr:terpene synthase family protein [Halomarina sp. BCD28]